MSTVEPPWPGLWVRVGDRIEHAPAADEAVARGYRASPDKGAVADGRRLTLLAEARRYQVGEAVRIIHVYEITEPGQTLYPMGPKAISGLRVDDEPHGPQATAEDPLEPLTYDGVTLPSPGVDYNWDITELGFDRPGRHRIEWRLGALRSNTLVVDVVAPGAP